MAVLFPASKKIFDDAKYGERHHGKRKSMSAEQQRKIQGRDSNPNVMDEGLNLDDIQLDASPIAEWTHPLRLLSTFSMIVFVSLNCCAVILILVSIADPMIS